MTTVFEHLIQNAQDATRKDGRIMFEAGLMNGVANVSISDTGEDMSPDFIIRE
jgi:signal transduction histidine kinase